MAPFDIVMDAVWIVQENHMDKYTDWLSKFGDSKDSMLAFSVLYGEIDEVVEPIVLSLGWTMESFRKEIDQMTQQVLFGFSES